MFPFDNFIDDWADGFMDDNIITPIAGTADNDLILLDGGDNRADGDAGNDMIIAGPGGLQYLRWGEGNDILIGLSGDNDTVEEFGDYHFTLSNTQLIADDGNGIVYTDLLSRSV